MCNAFNQLVFLILCSHCFVYENVMSFLEKYYLEITNIIIIIFRRAYTKTINSSSHKWSMLNLSVEPPAQTIQQNAFCCYDMIVNNYHYFSILDILLLISVVSID